ncbi:YIP1 family protein [Tropicimonas marinistellae]|uniref:YIP1 family protein n=1 Tax=Tropicimonas marinistellae TaxID=1739787 RepID=UPI00082B5BA4|nr:YIP1 family protein [Tropicimonas marinistellae]
MAITAEILRTYRAPRDVMRRLLGSLPGDDRPEARALVFLLLGCFIVFVSQVPGILAFDMPAEDAPPAEAVLGITFFIWLFVWPLLFYLLAALSHLAARMFGGRGSFTRARVALFWTVLAVSPIMLLRAIVEALIGPGAQLTVVDGLVALAFCAVWAISLIEAETPASDE